MTVPVQVPISASTANGVTTVFPYGFKVIQEEDLQITVDGVIVTTGFTVSGLGSDAGGNVTFTTAPANGAKVVRALVPVLERTTDYQQFGDWLADVVNPDFDRIWLALQYLAQNIGRALKLPIDTTTDQVVTEDAADRANKCLKFDASGNVVLSTYDPDSQVSLASSYAAAAASSASDAADVAATIANGSLQLSAVSITGGAIDGTPIGGTTRAAVSGTSGSFNAGLSVTGAAFTSRGIADNATATAVDIDSSKNVYLGGSSAAPGMKVVGVSTQVDYFYVAPANAGGAVRLLIDGSSANVNMAVSSKGAGSIDFYTNTTNQLQVSVQHTASANRYISMTGSFSGNPTISTSAGSLAIGTGIVVAGTATPEADNTRTLGTGALRWSTVYAGTGTINTSDAREKTAVVALTADEINAAKQLAKEIGAYKWLSAVASKGDAARAHIGLTVQRAIEIMTVNNLNPFAYGFICFDEWGDEFIDHPAVPAVEAVAGAPAVLAEEWHEEAVEVDGESVILRRKLMREVTPEVVAVEAVPAIPAWSERTQVAGSRYAFRYDELNLFIAAGFEARLSALEA